MSVVLVDLLGAGVREGARRCPSRSAPTSSKSVRSDSRRTGPPWKASSAISRSASSKSSSCRPSRCGGMTLQHVPFNIIMCLIGCLLGTLIGVLPGIGPVATIAMLLPVTFNLSPIAALIMLAGIYYGAQYGGSTTAILVNLPGESSSVVTCLDGYQMARQGRAGPALAIAAIGSFFAGCVVDAGHRDVRAAAGGSGAEVRPGGVFLADGAGPGRRGRARARLAHQGDRDGDPRPAARPGRHRRQFGRAALRLRHLGALRRHRLRHRRDGHVRHRRDHRQPGAEGAPRGLHQQASAS